VFNKNLIKYKNKYFCYFFLSLYSIYYMTGGLMQLVCYGAQDVYLTGNPEITYYKVVYRRHTNFAIECIENQLTGNPNFGGKSCVTILRNGDLATKILLRIRLNSVRLCNRDGGSCRLLVAWVKRLGHALIRNVEIDIGGSKIDKHYGTWMDIWYELTHTTMQERGYNHMIGDIPLLTQLHEVRSDEEHEVLPEYTLYIPLIFWFNRNTGLALPLIALQYHEVRLTFEFEDVNKLIVWSGTHAPNCKQFSIKEASILVDYIYLDSEERRKFAQAGHEYLIEQLQYTGDLTLSGGGRGSKINQRFDLSFNHPVKELIWALKNGAFNGESSKSLNRDRGRFLTYTNDNDCWETSALDYAAENIARGMISIDCNPREDCDTECFTLLPFRDQQIIDYCGLAKITVIFAPQLQSSSHTLYIVKKPLYTDNVNLGNDILAFTITIFSEAGELCKTSESCSSYSDGDECITGFSVDVTNHQLSLNDVSIPVEDWCDNRTTTCDELNPYDVSVVQPFNYGVRLDGKGNPIHDAVIQLNGHDRFDKRYGNYFNYVQPYHHHTRTPADGINVYTFALHPEQHQPSGTANLSRIDKTSLWVTFEDPYRHHNIHRQAYLNLVRDSKFYVYAFSYNVLRIMSGMGGLAYAN
jgi:hypothetical protein